MSDRVGRLGGTVVGGVLATVLALTAGASAQDGDPSRPAVAGPRPAPVDPRQGTPTRDQLLAGREPCGVPVAWRPYFTPGSDSFSLSLNLRRDMGTWVQHEREVGPACSANHLIIPVVVHVLLNAPDPKAVMPLEVVQSQIEALNRDFGAVTLRTALVPKACDNPPSADCPVTRLAAPPTIVFRLAARDEKCEATDGVEWKSTTSPPFNLEDPPAFLRGQLNAEAPRWDPAKYLNIWVVNAVPGALGVSSFPLDPPELQGLVINQLAFGNSMDTSLWPASKGGQPFGFEFGRTTTHEAGHWLGIFHPWGPLNVGDCGASDEVSDTPQQSQSTSACSSALDTCPDAGNDLCYDFMDYSDDQYRLLFTAGQVERMRSILHKHYPDMLTSAGHIAPVAGADDWLADGWDDEGKESYSGLEPPYVSTDLWVRAQEDGDEYTSEQSPAPGATHHVYVRVRNRGCAPTTNSRLLVWWARAGAEIGWPWRWGGDAAPATGLGGQVGTIDLAPIAPGRAELVHLSFVPPAVPIQAGMTDTWHMAYFARIEPADTPPAPLAADTGLALLGAARASNDLAAKSLWIADPWDGVHSQVTVWFTNPEATPRKVWLVTHGPWRPDLFDFTRYADVRLVPGTKLLNTLASPVVGPGCLEALTDAGETGWRLTCSEAELGPFILPPGAAFPMQLELGPQAGAKPPAWGNFVLEVQQRTAPGGMGELISGGVVGLSLEPKDSP